MKEIGIINRRKSGYILSVIILSGSNESPVCNPAFFVKNWNAENASVLINGEPAKDARIGINHEIEGTDLVVFLFLEKDKPVTITIIPE